MRSISETRERWDATFSNNANLSDLRDAVRRSESDNPCNTGLRSICWKAFLVFENLDQSTWPRTILDSRGAYNSLKEHFMRDIRHPDDLSAIDPLADDESSPWHNLRKDEIIRAEIFQDVERCMPENSFFREPPIQSKLLDILFVYCKLNSDVGYRQGMHELLAPILWVVSGDAVKRPESKEEAQSGDELMLSTLDEQYVEHDSFTIFCIVMQTAKSFYEITGNSSQPATSASNNSPIVERSRRIHESYLMRTDRELTEHLTAIDILPQIFVIRWIRLLFGREFPFEQVLCLWDVIFAEDPALDLVDFVCVAMLLRVRWQLLEADYSSALTLLLRYPVPAPPHGPVTFVQDAIYLRKHLNPEGGNHLISVYTGRLPEAAKKPRHAPRGSGLHTPQRSVDGFPTSPGRSPVRSPGQFLADQGGLEGILQEAAKGVYRRGEKWGFNQAIRDAVQGLQQGPQMPRRPTGSSRWSLDEGRQVPSNSAQLQARVNALEDRNKELAKMLQDTMEDLTKQAKKFEEEKVQAAANALTLTVAKLQFVHVYLENSSMPLGNEAEAKLSSESEKPAASEKPSFNRVPSLKKEDSPAPRSRTPVRKTAPPPPSKEAKPPRNGASQSPAPTGSPFHQPRPSLADSSYSWMLNSDAPGSDGSVRRPSAAESTGSNGSGARTKSDFVSALPFTKPSASPEKKRTAARGKNGFLFGESDDGPLGGRSSADADDGFTMGTLKGVGSEQ